MRKYGKWALALGLMAATPGLGFAAPWDRDDKGSDKAASASKAPAKSQNQKVADDIASALRQARVQGYDVEIEFKQGTAILKGRVLDPQMKAKATQVVERVPGVDQVDNQLAVSAPAKKSPAAPTGGIEQAGGRSAAVPNRAEQASYKPTTPNADRVKQVNYEPAAVQAAAAAAPNAGSNQAVAEQIAAALSAASLDGYDIEVKYQNGVAFLGGTVGTPAQRFAAERVVSQVPGVQSVQNQLRPTQPSPMGPQGMGPQGMGPMGPGPMMAGYGPMGPQGMGPMGPGPMMGPNGPIHPAAYQGMGPGGMPAPPTYGHPGAGASPAAYNNPSLPDYAWPTYAQYPNSAAISYPSQYSASAWPYIGPFYPYPQVPLGWRDATLRWDDGQWSLQFRQRTDKWWWFMNPNNW